MKAVLAAVAALLMVTSVWADPPASSGAVIRFGEEGLGECVGGGDPWFCCTGPGEGCNVVALMHTDLATGLFAVMGVVDLPLWCDTFDPTLFELAEYNQWGFHPNELDVVKQLFRADDTSTYVYEIVPGLGLCEHVAAFDPVATGTSDGLGVDNNALVSLDTNRANAWGYRFIGVLTTQGGDLAQFMTQNRCHVNNNNGFCIQIVQLH